MFFLVVQGQSTEVSAWKRVAINHAAALGLGSDVAQERISDQADLLVAVLDHAARDISVSQSRPRTRAVAVAFELLVSDTRPETATSVVIDSGATCIRVWVPFASPDQTYIRRSPAVSLVTNDLRLAVARHPPALDPHGVYALLQYGAIPAPFTLFRDVERVRPGHEARLGSSFEVKTLERTILPDAPGPDGSEALVVSCLDRVLLREPRPSAIFFSGGVDSSLLAARFAAAGVCDVPLLHYSFGPDDPETVCAERIASSLGMPFECIEDSTDAAVEVLSYAARDYSYPFGDYSSLPTNRLVRASSAWLPPGSAVIDGTGADGAFACGFKMERSIRARYRPLAWLPAWIGQLAGRVHARTGSIATDWGVGSALRLVHRATTKPELIAAVITQNCLHGECFHAAREVRSQVDAAVLDIVASLTSSHALADRASTLDLVHVCGGIYAAKDFDPLRHRGVDAVYPFLHPEVLGPSLRLPWSARCPDDEQKGLLKRALARHVPSDLVYRRKRGFRPRIKRFFSDGRVREFIADRALRRDSLLAEFLDWGGVDVLVSRASQVRPLHGRAYNLLWVLAFAGSWLDGLTDLEMSRQLQDEYCGDRLSVDRYAAVTTRVD